MSADPHTLVARRRTRLRAALCWLLAGTALLLLTPLHAWMPLVGWAPMLTLVVSPLLIVLVLEPGFPLRAVGFCVRAAWEAIAWPTGFTLQSGGEAVAHTMRSHGRRVHRRLARQACLSRTTVSRLP